MDLIYTDEDRTEIGVLKNFTIDFEESKKVGDNTFQIEQSLPTSDLTLGQFFYIDGTEYGGHIETIKCDTERQIVYAKGRTWRGMLEGKIIVPDSGSAYLTVSGDANSIIGAILSRVEYTDLFCAKSASSGITITNFKFDRYTSVYAGLYKMLAKNGAKLNLEWKNGKIEVSAVPITDFSSTTEISSDMFDFTLEKSATVINHMIGLGSGELTERQVVHKYLDEDGNISDTQVFFGEDEVVATYDNSNSESEADLEAATEDALLDAAIEDKLSISSNGNLSADIGDKFMAYSMELDLQVTQYVVTKIVTITDSDLKIQYKVGDLL